MKNETRKSQTRVKKEEKVAELEKSFSQVKNLIFWDYSGLTVPAFQLLREQLAQTGAQATVVKNTLINLALKNAKLYLDDTGSLSIDDTGSLSSLLEGPTAILFANDEIGSLKILAKFIKDAGVGRLKFGFLERKFANAEELEYLATLPSRESIMGQISNLLYQPIYDLVGVLQGNLKNLVFVLEARG